MRLIKTQSNREQLTKLLGLNVDFQIPPRMADLLEQLGGDLSEVGWLGTDYALTRMLSAGSREEEPQGFA